MSIKTAIRELTPPLLWRCASRLRHAARRPRAGKPSREPRPSDKFPFGCEQPAEFYDLTFEEADHWKQHYTESHYYPLWTVVADRICRAGAQRVLDIGCGPGQVACLLRDRGIPQYCGVDFSAARLRQARAVCPEYEFAVEDVFLTDRFDTMDYDAVLVMEFLEHIQRDTEVLERLRPGTYVLATVPNFPSRGHVRHFEHAAAVRGRYAPLLGDIDVTTILADNRGKSYYLIEGRVK